jgi:hypothetical protein
MIYLRFLLAHQIFACQKEVDFGLTLAGIVQYLTISCQSVANHPTLSYNLIKLALGSSD